MKLTKLTERVWFYPFETERDRPNLGYIRGDNWSLAVDAGHSEMHLREFYRALEDEGLPLPRLTVLTHWHWDHTFAMHALHGLSLSGARTDRELRRFREEFRIKGREHFLDMHQSIRNEYGDGAPVIITTADIVVSGEVTLDAGNCPIRVFPAVSPHTDDCMLIHVPGERVLFNGDACSGKFPTWDKDPALALKLASVIASVDADICLEGHWTPMSREETLMDLTNPDST